MERQAYIRPSLAAVWSKCRGYAALSAAVNAVLYDEVDNEVREDGTACHWLAAEVWDGRSHNVGGLSPNGRELTEEMFIAVDEYHKVLRSWGVPVNIERTIPVSKFFPGVSDGTPDADAYDPAIATVYIADLKYGFRPVDVWRNLQLIIYGWTRVCMLTQEGHAPQRVSFTIFQPRCPHRDGSARTWVADIHTLAALAAELAAAALECYAPTPMCTVNPGCGDCTASGSCMTLKAVAGRDAEVSYDATPLVLTPNQIGYELSRLMAAQQRMEARITGLSAQAEMLIRRGTSVAGYEMGRKATRWRWRDGVDVARLGQMFDVDVDPPKKFKTVAQLRGDLPEAVIAMYAEKPEGALTLRLVDPNEAMRKFER